MTLTIDSSVDVKQDDKAPLRNATRIKPIKDHIIANILPRSEVGVMSPYLKDIKEKAACECQPSFRMK